MSDPLLTPFQIGNLSLKNRMVSTPHAPALAKDGMPKERYQRYHLDAHAQLLADYVKWILLSNYKYL